MKCHWFFFAIYMVTFGLMLSQTPVVDAQEPATAEVQAEQIEDLAKEPSFGEKWGAVWDDPDSTSAAKWQDGRGPPL